MPLVIFQDRTSDSLAFVTYCGCAGNGEVLYLKRSMLAPMALQRMHTVTAEEIARRVGYPECMTAWAVNEMLRFAKQRFSGLSLLRISSI